MSEWNKLKEWYRQPPLGMTRSKIIVMLMAEGDKLQEQVLFLQSTVRALADKVERKRPRFHPDELFQDSEFKENSEE